MTDLTYKTDNQIIMEVLYQIAKRTIGGTSDDIDISLYEEIEKRIKEQRQHIPFHIRVEKENK